MCRTCFCVAAFDITKITPRSDFIFFSRLSRMQNPLPSTTQCQEEIPK